MRKLMWMGALSACLMATACSKTDAENTAAAPPPKPDAKAEAARMQAAAKVPAELAATGVSVTNVVVKKVSGDHGDELEVTGTLKNASAKAVDGVNLLVTFKTADGRTLGGHNTQQFFQPALAAGGSQALVLRAPAIGGTIDAANAAGIDVVNLVRAGQSPDGWKPLDPNNLPEPRVVRSEKAVTLPAAAPAGAAAGAGAGAN